MKGLAALALTLSLLLSIILHTGILIAKPKAKVLNPTPVSYVIVIASFVLYALVQLSSSSTFFRSS